MITSFTDPFDALLSLQRALEERSTSEWAQDSTTSRGPFPPVNVFQKGEDLLAVVELPGVEKNEIKVEAKENTIRIFGKKAIKYDDGVSVHRRERLFGEFDRTLSVPVAIEADGIIADYKNGVLSLHLPRAHSAKPRNIEIR